MEKEQDPRGEDAGLDDRLEVELGRQNLLRTKRTALPQQTPTTMDEKRGEKLKKVRWRESGLVVNSEGKKWDQEKRAGIGIGFKESSECLEGMIKELIAYIIQKTGPHIPIGLDVLFQDSSCHWIQRCPTASQWPLTHHFLVSHTVTSFSGQRLFYMYTS